MTSREIWPYVGTAAELRLTDGATVTGWISGVDRPANLEPDEVPYVYVEDASGRSIAIDIYEVARIVPTR
jgi:hypothetical protein